MALMEVMNTPLYFDVTHLPHTPYAIEQVSYYFLVGVEYNSTYTAST